MDILIWIIIVIIVLGIWICTFDTSRFTVSEYEYADKRIVKSLKVVFLSDLHCKMYGPGGRFLIEKIKQIGPDLIICGGDMINARQGAKTDKVVGFLRELNGEFPIIYAYGNHELRLKIYPENYGDVWEKYTEALSEFGLKVTENGSVKIGDSGVNIISFSAERKYYKRNVSIDMEPSYIAEKAGAPDPGSFNILLAHNPGYFDTYAAYGADLTLSGHLHGGLVRIPVPVSKKAREEGAHVMRGLFSPRIRLFPKFDGGRFDKEGRSMIVSRGLGTHTIPVRVFNPGDLVVIDLKPHGGV
ncbi:MAG: metallophosphoesterase [Lachnospiraceae bacterium]|nr:metallophosphoesterase [Lachnospiraceae bacterium]MBP5472862.1 metallophosphoesterase [Lachnospiraceae bacterium]